jgi:hypothetical protein
MSVDAACAPRACSPPVMWHTPRAEGRRLPLRMRSHRQERRDRRVHTVARPLRRTVARRPSRGMCARRRPRARAPRGAPTASTGAPPLRSVDSTAVSAFGSACSGTSSARSQDQHACVMLLTLTHAWTHDMIAGVLRQARVWTTTRASAYLSRCGRLMGRRLPALTRAHRSRYLPSAVVDGRARAPFRAQQGSR